MSGRMRKSSRKALEAAAVAEAQAIAIYEAECFWVRNPDRRALLAEILAEEKSHRSFLAEWVKLGGAEEFLNRASGWVLGSLLSALPWRAFCRVQSWAENQAKSIYLRAVASIEGDPEILDPSRLREGLIEAAESEDRHARRFRRPSGDRDFSPVRGNATRARGTRTAPHGG